MAEPWNDITIILERGDPKEIIPDKVHLWRAAAHRYLKRDHPQEAKDRVKAVWVDGQHRPAWSKEQEMPDLRGSIKGFITKEHREGDVRVVDEVQLVSATIFPAEDTDFG